MSKPTPRTSRGSWSLEELHDVASDSDRRCFLFPAPAAVTVSLFMSHTGREDPVPPRRAPFRSSGSFFGRRRDSTPATDRILPHSAPSAVGRRQSRPGPAASAMGPKPLRARAGEPVCLPCHSEATCLCSALLAPPFAARIAGWSFGPLKCASGPELGKRHLTVSIHYCFSNSVAAAHGAPGPSGVPHRQYRAGGFSSVATALPGRAPCLALGICHGPAAAARSASGAGAAMAGRG